MTDVCIEENGSPGKVFFPLFFADFIIMGYSIKIPTKAESIELFVCQGNNLWKFWGEFKKSGIFTWNFHRFWFLAIEFLKLSHSFAKFSRET